MEHNPSTQAARGGGGRGGYTHKRRGDWKRHRVGEEKIAKRLKKTWMSGLNK